MKLDVVCVGKLKEAYWREAMAEYAKRMGRYATLSVVEVAESRNLSRTEAAIRAAKKEEGERLLAACKGKIVALDLGGQEVSSEELASYLKQATDRGEPLSFVIGGSDGLDDAVLAQAAWRIRFGRITLPHQLCRVVLAEQLYRACCINHGVLYHK